MIKNAVSSLMVRLHLPFAAPASTYHALLPLPLPRQRASTSASVPLAGSGGAAMSTTAQTVADQKRALRSDVRRALKALSPDQRTSEDLAIQGTILNSSWFKESKRLCAYISCAQLREVDTSKILAEVLSPNSEHDGQGKGLYVPRVEDKNRNMRMLKITTMDDLVKNSMNILEPSPLDASGNAREDVLSASSPVDLFLLPGQAFDRTGRRLGRGGGYYDTFLMKYQELAKEKGWSQPLLGMTLHIFRSLVVYICVHNFLSHNFTESFGILVYYICVKYTFGPSTLPLASFWSLYFKNRTKVNLFRVDSFEVEGPEWTVLKLMDQNEPMDGVALSYSVQIMEDGIIPVNSTDVPIDALVTSSGVIPFSPAAFDRM